MNTWKDPQPISGVVHASAVNDAAALNTIIAELEHRKMCAKYPDYDGGWDSALQEAIDTIRKYWPTAPSDGEQP